MDRFIVISGCSGGGKSTLLSELKSRGHAVVEEPGRRIIAEELARGGHALPWIDLAAFAERAIETSLHDLAWAAETSGIVFFDRGLIDAAAALEHASGRRILDAVAGRRYNRRVFLTPPWPEIYVRDFDRNHGLEEAVAEYERLRIAFTSLDYGIEILPRVGVSERADIVLKALNSR